MEFTTEQAKTIFDLIRTVNPYAYPLLISLIFPIYWFTLRKTLGISNETSNVSTPISNNLNKKIFSTIASILTLKGDKADRIIFYICILAFIIGGITLKFGEKKEEIIRQKAISLKKCFEKRNLLFMSYDDFISLDFTKKEIDDILYNYPNEFTKTSSINIACMDTNITKIIKTSVYPLLESYLRLKLRNNQKIDINTIGNNTAGYENVQNFFTMDIIYEFLSLPSNKGKYDIDVVNGRTLINQSD